MLHVNQENGIVNGLVYRARCANPTTSTTNIELPALSGFTNDYFNNVYYIQVIKNNDSVGNAPEGDEPRKITDYVSATGTFTTDAFSAAVGVQDEVLVIHESIVKIESLTDLIVADFVISDKDDFDVADVDADNARWDVEYITGTEGGSADINTTVAGKLMVKVDPDATPTEARYAVSHNLPFYADYLTVTADLNCTWGTDTATAKAAGMIFSAGTAYDANNFLAVERQKGTAINRYQVRGKLNNVAVTTTSVNTTDDAVSFKVQRLDNIWRFYYSTSQYASEDWVLISQVEDPTVYMTNQVALYLEVYTVGSADAETVQGDFDNFRYLIGSGGGGQYIAGDYSSAWVTSDIDGSVLERQESLQKAVGVTAATGGQFEEDGSTDLWDALVVDSSSDANITAMTGNRDGAVIERLSAVENAIGITSAATLTGYEEDGSGANLFKTLVAKQGVTDGAGTTATFADTARTEAADYWIGAKIVALSGSAAGQMRTIVDSVSGTLTVEPLLAAAPGNAVPYVIINEKASDYILGDNTANNAYDSSNVIVNKDGSVLERLEALLSTILAYGTFTTDSATVPADTTRTEGNDYWNGQLLIPLTGNCAFQPRLIVDYTVTTDIFTLDPEHPFTTTPGLVTYVIVANDGQLVPAASSANNYTSAHVIGNKGDAATNDNMSDIATTSTQAKLRLLLNRLSSDAFTATIQGAARTELDTMINILATYIYPSGGAWSAKVNNSGAALTNLYDAITAFFTVVGIDGTNAFDPAMFGGAQTTVEAAFTALSTAIGAEYDGSPDLYDTVVTGYDSTAIAANADGSVLERLEFVQSSMIPDTGGLSFKGPISTGGSATSNKIAALAGYGDDYFNNLYYMQIICTTDDAAPVTEVRKITDYTSLDGTFVTDAFSVVLTTADETIIFHESLAAVGRNDADNTIDTSTTAANEDGSILERLEHIQEAVSKGTGTSMPSNKSLYDIIGAAYIDGGGGLGVDSVLTDLGLIHTDVDTVIVDTAPLWDTTLTGASIVSGSIASFIASGGTSLGTVLPVSKSLYNVIGTGYVDAGGGFGTDSVLADLADIHTDVGTIITATAATVAGTLQIVSTTESLNQIAGDWPLFTGTTQPVVLEKLNLKMPTGAAGGAITSISIQTDDATPGVIISSATGIIGNLTSEADLSWTGALLINVGTIINLTINGGAHGGAYVVTVVAQYRAVVAGGTLVA